jgi:hypothetical protein
MARQRLSLMKIGGIASDVVLQRLEDWAAARMSSDPNEWSSDQWPAQVRMQIDGFADQLRQHGCELPVISFAEWSDLWSMGDIFERWLTPRRSRPPLCIYGDRFVVCSYTLPDGGRLARLLKTAGPQQFPEYDLFITRLREAVGSWEGVVDRAVLIVLREVFGGLVTDEEVIASMSVLPDWLTG